MSRTRIPASVLGPVLATAGAAALFAAWLHPRLVAAWLGAWTTALCG